MLLVVLAVGQGCTSLVPTPVPTPRATQTGSASGAPTVRPTITSTPSAGTSLQVDVLNGSRRVIVSISGAGLWWVEPDARVTLFNSPDVRPAGIEIIEVTGTDCRLLARSDVVPGDFTIDLRRQPTGSYSVAVRSGAALSGPPGAEETTTCMG